MRFTTLIWKNLLRRRFRTSLTFIALASAITSVVALLGIARGFQKSFADVYRSHQVDIVVSRQGAADRLSSSIDQDLAEQIQGAASVKQTALVLLETLSLEEEGVYGIPAMGIRPESWMMDSYEMERKPTAGDQIWLGVHLASRLGLSSGDSINIFGETYPIADVFTSRSTWENGSMIVPLALLQELTGREGQITYVNVRIKEESIDRPQDEILGEILEIDQKLLPLATEDFVSTDTRMQIASAMAWMTSVIAIVIGAIGTLNTMMTSVIERTGEIGILRAIGWSKRRIVGMILGESALLAVLASLAGCIGAIILTYLLSRSPAVAGTIAPSMEPIVLIQGVLVGGGIGLFGALIPAWRAARLLPTQAFREL